MAAARFVVFVLRLLFWRHILAAAGFVRFILGLLPRHGAMIFAALIGAHHLHVHLLHAGTHGGGHGGCARTAKPDTLSVSVSRSVRTSRSLDMPRTIAIVGEKSINSVGPDS